MRLVAAETSKSRRYAAWPALLGLLLTVTPLCASEPMHAVSLHGTPRYAPDFQHFDYVNPEAPRGGRVRFSALGTFDSLNPFILKGNPAEGLGGIFDTLTYHSADEAFSEYGLLAETIEIADDNSWVEYQLRPEARFHDGSPVLPEDVIFSFNSLISKGSPIYRNYYKDVAKVEKTGPLKVRFSFSRKDNPELPLIIGQLNVLSAAWWKDRDFSKTTLEPPLGSGPYKVQEVKPGRSISYVLDDNYWGRDLPVNRGRDNFGAIRYDYYRDGNVALEAFKAGQYDIRNENVAKNWAVGYDGPALQKGWIKQLSIPHEIPQGMQGFIFNTRKEMFKDRRVREAIAQMFDFNWSNRTLFYNAYTRTQSYFANSELASSGLPEGEELEILQRYREQLPPGLFTTPFQAATTDGSGRLRNNARKALGLLKQAGWVLEQGKLVNSRSGQRLSFEMMLVQPDFERVVLPFKKNLQQIGIEMQVRTVDSSQYTRRLDDFDFDMTIGRIAQSLSPGNEQRNFFHSASADQPGSRNMAGVRDTVVDELVELVINAPTRESLVQRTRALDRVLLWGHYVIPQWYLSKHRIAIWDMFGRPEVVPRYALGLDTWWIDAQKAAVMEKNRGQ